MWTTKTTSPWDTRTRTPRGQLALTVCRRRLLCPAAAPTPAAASAPPPPLPAPQRSPRPPPPSDGNLRKALSPEYSCSDVRERSWELRKELRWRFRRCAPRQGSETARSPWYTTPCRSIPSERSHAGRVSPFPLLFRLRRRLLCGLDDEVRNGTQPGAASLSLPLLPLPSLELSESESEPESRVDRRLRRRCARARVSSRRWRSAGELRPSAQRSKKCLFLCSFGCRPLRSLRATPQRSPVRLASLTPTIRHRPSDP